MKNIYLVIGSLLLINNVQARDVQVCPGTEDLLGVQSAEWQTMVAGNSANVKLQHIPKLMVGKGNVHLDMIVEGITVHSEYRSLCDVANGCQLQAHQMSTSEIQFQVPEHVPENFETNFRIMFNDNNGKLLSCVEVLDVLVKRSKNNKDDVVVVAKSPSGESRGLSAPELDFLYQTWKTEHGMKYDTAEDMQRKRIFATNLQSVALHNAEGHSYTKAMNQFGALTAEEFRSHYFGLRMDLKDRTPFAVDDDLEATSRLLEGVATEVDWVGKGAVTQVKNQGACGSCWAFSTTGALEGAYFLKTGTLMEFSEQELVSCDTVDQGCNGGLMDQAYKWLQQQGGICTEGDYPYTTGGGQCAQCKSVPGTAPKSIHDVEHTEAALLAAVNKQPVSVAIEADQLAFQFYSRGVLTGRCGAKLDHGVLVVGYGEDNGVKYWKVKNSWGPQWGMNGYILLQRGKAVQGGQCGVLMSASYPEL